MTWWVQGKVKLVVAQDFKLEQIRQASQAILLSGLIQAARTSTDQLVRVVNACIPSLI